MIHLNLHHKRNYTDPSEQHTPQWETPKKPCSTIEKVNFCAETFSYSSYDQQSAQANPSTLNSTNTPDLTIAKDQNHAPSLHRSLSNLGRLYVQLHKYKEAASTFRELLTYLPNEPSYEDSPETAEHVWVLHDLGRGYYRLEEFGKASECGAKGTSVADAVKDKRWGLDCR